MSKVHIVTDYSVKKVKFECKSCFHKFDAYFIDTSVIGFLECDKCGKIAGRKK